MTVGIDVDTQWLLYRIRSVQAQRATQCQHTFVHGIQFFEIGNREVEVQLLGNRPVGPRRSRKPINSLECKTRAPLRRKKIEPILSHWIVGLWRFVPLSVDESEKRTPKFCADARIGAVQNDLHELGNGQLLHTVNVISVPFEKSS